MNEELAAYITHLCELSGHTTWIKKDLILAEPGEDFIYDAFTMVEEYYAYGHYNRYAFSGTRFGSESFEIFKKFAIMYFAVDIRAAHDLPPITFPVISFPHPNYSIETASGGTHKLIDTRTALPTTFTTIAPDALVPLSYLMGTPSDDLLSLVLEPSGAGYVALFEYPPASTPTSAKLQNNSNHVGIL